MMQKRSVLQVAQGVATATLCTGTPLAHAAVTYVVTGSADEGGLLNTTPQTVVSGEKAMFLVKPNAGYTINTVAGCNGKLSGTIYFTGVITAACTVNATFKPKDAAKYTLTVSQAGTGSGTISGGGQLFAGTTVKLVATPAIGSTFTRWSPAPCAASFTMLAKALTCTATFTKEALNSPEMIKITGKCFQMGSPTSDPSRFDDEPQHEVCVDDFEMGKYEVTVAQFKQFVGATGYKTDAETGQGCSVYNGNTGYWEERPTANWKTPGFTQTGKHPVVCVSKNDAIAYTQWLSTQTGENDRLATEAEWEYAARAGTTTIFWWGDTASHDNANYGTDNCCAPYKQGRDQWLYTAPVGSFPASPFGLYDTAGNVWEWTCSDYSDPYDGAEKACSTSGAEGRRSIRGGSWDNTPIGVRSANRATDAPANRYYDVGFRVARSSK